MSAELPDGGERFEGLLPPVVAAPTFAIRKPAIAVFTLRDYVSAGIMSAASADILRSGVRDRLGKNIFTPVVEAKARHAMTVWGRVLADARRAGVKIAYGTDAGVFEHGRNGEEAELMVRLGGMTPREVLVSATTGAADLLGIASEVGTLDPGKSADLIAVDGDPLTDTAAFTRVAYVMVRGKPIPMK